MNRLFRWAGILLPALFLIGQPAKAQFDPTVSMLPPASAPSGGEIVRVSQNGSTKAATISQINNTVQQRLKRAAIRAAAANPEDAPEDATGITLSMATSADSNLTRIYGTVAGAAPLQNVTIDRVARFTGGRYTLESNNRVVMPVANAGPVSTGNLAFLLPATPGYSAWGWEVETRTEAQKLQVRIAGNTASGVRVVVDGRYVSKTPLAYASNNTQNYLTLEFGTRKSRLIRIEGAGSAQIVNIAVAPTASLAREPQVDRVVAFAVGDSYSEGTGATIPGLFAFTKAWGRHLGWTDVRQVAVGSTGFYSNSGGNRKTIRQQVADWFVVNSDIAPTDVDVVTVAGGYNDFNFYGSAINPAQYVAEVTAALQTIRAACPNAIILVFGSHAGARGPDAQTLAVDAAIQTAFAQWGDARSAFIPIASDASPWTFGTGNEASTKGDGNADVLIAPDGSHPNNLGHNVYDARGTAAIRAVIARM